MKQKALKPKAMFLMNEGMLSMFFTPADIEELHKLLDFVGPPVTADELAELGNKFADVEVICGSYGMSVLTEKVLAQLPKVRVIIYSGGTVKPVMFYHGTTLKPFMTEEAWQRGIRITNAAYANARPVAEFALALIILSLKRALAQAAILRTKRTFDFPIHDPLVVGTYKTTVGILSLSMVGRKLVELLKILDVSILAYDPTVDAATAAMLGVELCSMEEVFSRSHVVSCHMPLLPATTHILRRHHFESMRPGATFVNTARGGIVAESEMIEVLQRRPDLFAALDVTDIEPAPSDSLLHTLPNVFLTPHIAGSAAGERFRMGGLALEEIRRYVLGKPLVHEVAREKLPLLA